MKKEIRPKVIAALKKSHTTDDCKKIAKKHKVKLSYVYYVRKQFAKECGYKKRGSRPGKGKPIVTLNLGAGGTGRKPAKRHAAKSFGMRVGAIKMLVDHGNELPAEERTLYRAALDLVTKGD